MIAARSTVSTAQGENFSRNLNDHLSNPILRIDDITTPGDSSSKEASPPSFSAAKALKNADREIRPPSLGRCGSSTATDDSRGLNGRGDYAVPTHTVK